MQIRYTHPRPWLRTATEPPADGGGKSDTDTKTDPPKSDPNDTSGTDELAKWKALARKHEAQAKTNAEAAKKLAEIDEKSKTDAEKVADRIKAAEERATAAEAKALRLEVATSKGLTPAQAKRLTGSTVEELEADADELLEAFGGTKAPPAGSTKPRQNTKPVPGGGVPDDGDTLTDADLDKIATDLAN